MFFSWYNKCGINGLPELTTSTFSSSVRVLRGNKWSEVECNHYLLFALQTDNAHVRLFDIKALG